MKKQGKPADSSITGALLKSLLDSQKQVATSQVPKRPSIGSTPLPPAADYQDDGSGYNANYTTPQK